MATRGRFLYLLLLLAGVSIGVAGEASAASEQRHALVIGNGAYVDARLKNPANDAGDIAAKLRQLGFSVTELVDADQRKMETAVREFSRVLGQGSVGLFFFAGHGIEVGGENFLLPVGADIQSEVDVRYKSLSAGYVLESMRAAGNSMNLVILDACRNNPYARSFRSGGSRGLARMNAAKGSLVLYATQPGDVAEDGKGRNGLFTEKLLASPDQPGLKAEEVFKQTALAVDQASGQKQTPWQEGVLLGDFYFNPATDGGGASPPATQPPPPPAPPVDLDRQAELEVWKWAKEKDTANSYRQYLDQFPQGQFAAMARLGLEEKQRQPPAQKIAPVTPQHFQQQSSQPPGATLWSHNGSKIYLVAEGNTRKFYYLEPRPGMRDVGVTPGTLLFSGSRAVGQYSGVAYVFSSTCGPQSYPVSGPVSDDQRQVTLYGQAPKLDSNCHVLEHREDVLLFTYEGD